jgi:hypothetical protein
MEQLTGSAYESWISATDCHRFTLGRIHAGAYYNRSTRKRNL